MRHYLNGVLEGGVITFDDLSSLAQSQADVAGNGKEQHDAV